MRPWTVLMVCGLLAAAVAVSTYVLVARPFSGKPSGKQLGRTAAPAAAEPDLPPPGLPILASMPRDRFKVINPPRYVSVAEGNQLLIDTEPVLGLVLGGQARAYSTNQLNDHEMVLDDIGGTPVLVTY